MKKNLLIVFVIYAFLQIESVCQSDLEIVWEKRYQPKNLKYTDIPTILTTPNSYIFVLSGQPPILILKNPGLIEIDKSGNLINNISTNIQVNLPTRTVYKDENEHKYHYFIHIDGKPYHLVTDENGDSLSFDSIYLPDRFYSTSNPINLGDTIVQYIIDFENVEGYLYYYNKNFEKSKEIKFDKPKTNLYLFQYPFITIDNNKNEIILLYSGPDIPFQNTREYFVLVKYDLSGNLIWENEFKLPNIQKFEIEENMQLNNGNIIVPIMTGNTNEKEMYFIEISEKGEFVSKTLLNHNLKTTQYFKFKKLSNDNIACYGLKPIPNSEFNSINFLKIFDSNGELISNYEWRDRPWISNLTETENGNILFAGSFKDTIYFLEVKLTPVSVEEKNTINLNANLLISPNPTSDFITISISEINHTVNRRIDGLVDKIRIFNTLGIEIKDPALSINGDEVRIDVSHLPTGVYFIKIDDKVERFVKI